MSNISIRERELIETLQDCAIGEGNGHFSTVFLQESLFGMHNQYTDEDLADWFGEWAVDYFRVSIAGLDRYN